MQLSHRPFRRLAAQPQQGAGLRPQRQHRGKPGSTGRIIRAGREQFMQPSFRQSAVQGGIQVAMAGVDMARLRTLDGRIDPGDLAFESLNDVRIGHRMFLLCSNATEANASFAFLSLLAAVAWRNRGTVMVPSSIWRLSVICRR